MRFKKANTMKEISIADTPNGILKPTSNYTYDSVL